MFVALLAVIVTLLAVVVALALSEAGFLPLAVWVRIQSSAIFIDHLISYSRVNRDPE